ncbi:MAG: N-formylglutamate amidohydrolase [Deltaproteobacteria bacterium]|nr:N-formylglutamate amidohydrolase [Deltaproteobacteria bacterium]
MATLVITVPYGGLFVPPMIKRLLGLGDQELGWENFRLADPLLLGIAADACQGTELTGFMGKKPLPERTLVSYAYSPLVSDPLGFLACQLSGEEHSFPKFIKEGATGKAFPALGPKEAEAILAKSAKPFLAELDKRCSQALESESLVLLLMLRSHGSKPLNHEFDRRYPRPQVCVGSHQGGKTPPGLAAFIGRTFRMFGLWPEPDWPNPGAFVPDGLQQSPRLLSAGISFRRDLYMDESTGKGTRGQKSLVRVLRTVFSLLEDELESVLRIRYRRKHPPKPPSMVLKAPAAPGGGGRG